MPSCRRPAWSTTISSPASAMKAAPANAAALASKSNDGQETGWRPGDARLAAHAVGPAAQSDRPLPARYRNRRYRPRAGTGGALERTDVGRAYLLGGAAHLAGRSRHARTKSAHRHQLATRRVAA